MRLNELYTKIQNETQLWPKKKKFFENAYKILLYSKSTQFQFRYMNKLFNKNSVKSPLCEYKEESYNSVIILKNQMENIKKQIIECLKTKNRTNENNENLMDGVNEILFKNIIDRRLLLTKQILLTEKFFEIYTTSFKLMPDRKSCKINEKIIPISEILNIFLFTSHKYPDDISEKSFLKIYSEKKKLEAVKNIKKFQDIISKNEIIEKNKKKEIEKLRKQKDELIYHQQKKEQMLNVLKKYLKLKENFTQNKQKYKWVLYMLNKIKNENNDNFTYMDKVEQILNDESINNEIDNNSMEELKSFEVNENLLKDIEKSLTSTINNFFKNEENKDINEKNNNYSKYTNNNIIRNNNKNINIDEDKKE